MPSKIADQGKFTERLKKNLRSSFLQHKNRSGEEKCFNSCSEFMHKKCGNFIQSLVIWVVNEI